MDPRCALEQIQRDEYADGDMPEGVEIRDQSTTGSASSTDFAVDPVIVVTKEQTPKDFFITRSDCEKHWYARGCGGCSS